MIPVDQKGESDCFRCCVASIFEMAPEEIPDFGGDARRKFPDDKHRLAVEFDRAFRKWATGLGIAYDYIEPSSSMVPWGYCVACGAGPRGPDHAVVWDAREDIGTDAMAHDPHPSREGIVGKPKYFVCFRLEDPALFRKYKGAEET